MKLFKDENTVKNTVVKITSIIIEVKLKKKNQAIKFNNNLRFKRFRGQETLKILRLNFTHKRTYFCPCKLVKN